MGAKAVILRHTAPVCVDHFLSGFLRPDAVLPVVFVRKAAARPAQHRQLHLAQRCHDIIAHPVCVGYLGILAHIEPLVDAAPEMLREVAVDLRVDMPLFVLFVDVKFCHFDKCLLYII